jgi:hypothetical protein
MSFETYWLIVPLVATVLAWIGIAALLLTRKHWPEPAEWAKVVRRRPGGRCC